MTEYTKTVEGHHSDVRTTEEGISARERFGGADLVASILGMLAGLGTFVFLGALFAAGAANVELQTNLLNQEGTLDEVEIVGALAAVAVAFVSFLVGGIAAGRMARFDGGMNGLGAGLWFLLLVAVFGALGAWVGAEYNAFAAANLPNWVSQIDVDDVTTAAVVMAAVSAAAILLGGYLGGRMGDAHNRKVDAALIDDTVDPPAYLVGR
ncbi:MAG TPA: hypothetical protein VFP67_03730 [Acidimicrobiia bacterium]|nr:hypothetical protein [Acidimicrobiia bacterium]